MGFSRYVLVILRPFLGEILRPFLGEILRPFLATIIVQNFEAIFGHYNSAKF